MKKFLTILLLSITVGAFAQKAKPEPMFTFAGKSGSKISMTWDEYLKSKKELTTADKNVTVKSFNVAILNVNGKDSVYSDYSNTGNVFSRETVTAIEKTHSAATPGNTIFLEAVILNKDGKEVKTPGMVIKFN